MKIRVLAMASVVAVSAPSTVAATGNFDADRITAIDAYVEGELSRADIPGAALVLVEGDHIVHARGFGRAAPSGAKVTSSTPFKLGSVSKSITAVAVAGLVEDGKVQFDAPVRRYLPWFRVGDGGASDRITVRELLTHTSGLPTSAGGRNFADRDASEGALEQAVRDLSSVKLGHDPGTRFAYSNANYQVLGAIVEATSGLRFSTFVGQRIFRPLGMSNSFAGAAAALPAGAAIGSRYWFGFNVPAPDVPSPRSLEPAGELYASAEDMGKFLGALLGHGQRAGARVLSDEMARGLFVPTATTPAGDGYAMGWRIVPSKDSFNIWHNGSTPDFHAHAALDFPSGRAFALLVNAETNLSGPKIGDLPMQVLRMLRGEKPLPVRRSSLPAPLFSLITLALLQLAAFTWWLPKARAAVHAASWPRIAVPFVLHVGAAVALVIAIPRLGQATFKAALMFAPDGAYVLAANGVIAIAWASVRLGIMASGRRPSALARREHRPERSADRPA